MVSYSTSIPYGCPCTMCGKRKQWDGELDARQRKVYRCPCGYVWHRANGSERPARR